ncbi:hypothetical protein DPSP01_007599 [Paraphaeosphaeria sporulosa]|uniref:Piwi-domain-containing protein n=1 Tax=Paraphaeosphaeria sporulosa TaxID=1460663 RepID=A0A177C4V0_9PLEO|nr:Piwi-domain-containing protein [Paraphaeosphaeria sporulosa]OAG02525.1 Piwi-domain-containing protein [Paraphaeosphaeria sporulosa]
MGGPSKRRAKAEKKGTSSSGNSSGRSRDATERSNPKSIPRLDGNRDPHPTGPGLSRNPVIEYSRPQDLKNISEALGYAGWCVARGLEIPGELPRRPGKFNTIGKPVNVTLNTFNVDKFPTQIVYQYDISWGTGTDASKRVLVKKIWRSKAVKDALGEPQNLWIYDGNKLAWCGKRLPRDELRIEVDLDAEEAQDRAAHGLPLRGARDSSKNKHKLYVKFTRQLDFSALQSFLNNQTSYSTECIDTINFLDHLMREGPSLQYTQIKKSFFQRGERRFDLGGGVEAFKGVFSSLRPCLNNKLEKGLTVNVDVANGTFWRSQPLGPAMFSSFNLDPDRFSGLFMREKKDWRGSSMKKDMHRFKKIGVSATHVKPHVQYTIDEVEGKDVNEATFTDRDGNTVSLRQYFAQKYQKNLRPGFPVVKMTKKIRGKQVYLPLEVLNIDANQRYNTKLSDKQTSEMIKFAVTLPKDRWAAVINGVQLLNWQQDRFLNHYGLKINPAPAKVKGVLLPPPKSCFGAKSRQAVVDNKDLLQGRWRLDGRVFALPNTDRPIKGWGICVVQGRGAATPDVAKRFAAEFVKIYTAHGGIVASHPTHGTTPWIGPGNLADGGEMVNKAYQATGNRYQQRPSLMFFIVNDRNIEIYRRIKKSMDIRFGVVSQVIQSKHAQTASGQYISNVCMKVNAKLGGATNVAVSQVIPKLNPKAASIPTMVVGADVSHPAPGAGSGEAASFAAITVSNDATFTRYWAEVQTNGHRVEMVTTSNIEEHFGHMAKNWMQRLGKGQPPKRVIYIRDGVSEGQYAAVLNEEVRDMKSVFAKLGCKTTPDFCVMIAGKRHHIRFFPEQGDRNKNPLPGTLVETGCTHPHEFDFYLCSHVAIKGTARPIHYQCILNENGSWQAAEMQQFLFEHSYQYIRSTTPVSLHPAVYYAHLAADRARAHVSDSPVSSGKKEAQGQAARSSTGSSSRVIEVAPLQPMLANTGIRETMWYI